MSSVNASGGRSTAKTITAAVLAVIAVLLIILAIMYFTEPARNLLIGSISSGPRAHKPRPLWGTASIVVAVICLIGAWFTVKPPKAKAGTSTSEPAATASK
ncbi:MAG: hypothetical protein J2P34_10820 [Actinobacteria bacterium]|nr:hypothetical protein [Actinomycetota bacterium]